MKNVMIIVKNELSTYLKNPSILAIVFLPIIMSKIITAAMNIAGQEIFLLSVWILFAQVMVGIMLTGPNIIKEREAKTIDALLCTPLTFREIMFSKGLAILILSMFSQINVYIINHGITSELFALIIPMLIGGSLFILLSEIIGLKVGTSQEGSAGSSIVMVLLFLIVSVYESFPEWIGKFMIMIPSISVAEIMNGIMADNTVLLLQSVIVFTWFVLGVIYIKYIEKNGLIRISGIKEINYYSIK